MAKKNNTNTSITEIVTEPKDFFERLGNKGVLIAFALLSLLLFGVFKDYILLKKLYVFKDIGSDTVNGLWPIFHNFANYSYKYGIPTWSFQEGMGQNILGGFLRDPFMMIGCLIAQSSMPKIFIYIELIKIISGGLIFYYFLKQLKVSNLSATIGCLLFSFSGFMIVGSSWYLFSFEAFSLALVLLGFELYYQKNKWAVFVISIALIGISMPFNVYITTIILLFYIVFRLGQTDQWSFKNFYRLIIKLSFLGFIGLLISAPFLLEGILQLLESPRGSGTYSYSRQLSSVPVNTLIDKFQFGSFITRLFNSNYLCTGDNFKGWQNFLEAPLSYCGIISLLLMPQVFYFVSKSQRKWYIFWVLVWIIPTLFPYFRYAFWLFSGNYYRIFSFSLALVFILYAVFALDIIFKTKKINLKVLIATLVISLLFLSYNYFNGSSVKIDPRISIFVKIVLAIYCLLLYYIGKNTQKSYIFKYALLIIIAFELSYTSGFSVNGRNAISPTELTEKKWYNDYSVEAINYIKKNETGFYRIDKNYSSSDAIHGSFNDNKMHDYYSTSIYSSFVNNTYINYLRENGVISKTDELEARYVRGLVQAPALQVLNNVKYMLSYGHSNLPWYNTHDSVASFSNVTILKSKFNLPFGYTYRQYITQSDFNTLSLKQKDLVSLHAFVLKNEDVGIVPSLKPYNLTDTLLNADLFSFKSYHSDVEKLAQNSLKISGFSDEEIKGTIKADEAEMMYLSFPFDKGWHLKLDGIETKLIYISNGMTGIYLPKGNHTVELVYETRLFYKGLWLTVIGLLCMIGLVIINKKGFNFFRSEYAPN